jgi:hypothetical protein
MEHWWVILLVPIVLAALRAVNWPTAVVLAAFLGLVSFVVGWVVALIVSLPMLAVLLIRARSRRRQRSWADPRATRSA